MTTLNIHQREARLLERVAELETELNTLDTTLHSIKSWCDAYPLDVFPEPDMKLVREALEKAGITLDSVSASNMRHVLNGIKKLIEEGGFQTMADSMRVSMKRIAELEAERDDMQKHIDHLAKMIADHTMSNIKGSADEPTDS